MRSLIIVAAICFPLSAFAADPTRWTSIIVRGDGTYDLKPGIASEHDCREALCYVQWSVGCDEHARQVEEQKRKDALAEIERAKRELDYRASHPCVVEKDGSKTCPQSPCSSIRYDKDGNTGYSMSSCASSGSVSIGPDRSIRVAACFQ